MTIIEFSEFTPPVEKLNDPVHATDWLLSQFPPIQGKTIERDSVFQPLDKASRYLSSSEFKKLVNAFNLAYQAHRNPCKPGDEFRKDRSLYITHPFASTDILADEKIEGDCLFAAATHDTVEDTHLSLYQLAKYLDKETARVVFPITKIAGSEDPFETEEKLFQMALKSKGGARSVLVKLADRIHNMRTLGSLNPASQLRIALQTWELYAPTAELFNIQNWANKLFALSGQYLWPDRFGEVLETRDSFSTEKNLNLLETATDLTKTLSRLSRIATTPAVIPASHDILTLVSPGSESDIEIHPQKTVPYYLIARNGEDFEKLSNYLNSQRLSIQNIRYDGSQGFNCDFAFGNQIFHIMARDMRSYLVEKASLLDLHRDEPPDNETIQDYEFNKEENFQMRKKIAEEKIKTVVQYIEQVLADKEEEGLESASLMRRLREKMNLPSAETNFIGVETPDGQRRILPSSSTVLDFAFDVWDKLGFSAAAAIVNGVDVPFSYEMKEGDKAEIIPIEPIPRDSQEPVRCMLEVEWLDWVRTPSARRRIQSGLESVLNIKAKCDEIRVEMDDPNPKIRQKGKGKLLRSVKNLGYEDFSHFLEYAKKPQSDARERGIMPMLKDQKRYLVGEKAISDLRKGWAREQNAVNLRKYITFERFLEQYGIGLVSPNEKKAFFEGYKEYIHSLPTFSVDLPNQKGYLALLTSVIAPFVDIQDIETLFNTGDLGALQARIVIRGETEERRVSEVREMIHLLENQFNHGLENIAVPPKREWRVDLPLHSEGGVSIFIGLFEKFGMRLKNFTADYKKGKCQCVFIPEPESFNLKPIQPNDVQEIIKLLQSQKRS